MERNAIAAHVRAMTATARLDAGARAPIVRCNDNGSIIDTAGISTAAVRVSSQVGKVDTSHRSHSNLTVSPAMIMKATQVPKRYIEMVAAMKTAARWPNTARTCRAEGWS
jgi:hypothetical protein